MAYPYQGCGDTPSPIVPFSVSIRSSRRKRSRLPRAPTPTSACEESAHYPVFDPDDPRHNPALGRGMYLEGVDSTPRATHSAGSIRWMQGLPGRSLRRARSGLQALRSGLHRRPARMADGDHVNNGLWTLSDSAERSSGPHERFSSTVSEASTEEDYEFGTDLFRTGYDSSDPKNETSKDISPPSTIPHTNPVPVSVLSTGGGLPLVSPVETLADAPLDEDPPTRMYLNVPRADDGPSTMLDDQIPANPPKSSDSPAPDEDAHASIREQPKYESSALNIPQATVHLGDVGPDMPFGTKNSHMPAEETNMTCVSRRSSDAIRGSQVEQVPRGETEVTVTTEEISSTGTSRSECQSGVVGEDSGPDPEVETMPLNLGDSGGMEYYLSLNTQGAGEVRESKSSDEEPSPNSLSEDDRDARLSPWPPGDKAERTSLLSLRDEYFLVDGKSPDLRPDRGDTPIKGERGFVGDGGLHSGPGLDRNLSIRTHEIPEIIGPGGPMGIPSPRPFRRDREGSDSTAEEYLVTYSLFHRHYFS
ncbi:hypothetical protein BDW62DRAFT_214361 [Aspergillus aurantiobrunneus]